MLVFHIVKILLVVFAGQYLHIILQHALMLGFIQAIKLSVVWTYHSTRWIMVLKEMVTFELNKLVID